MTHKEQIIYRTAINDAREKLIAISGKLHGDGKLSEALEVTKGSRAISELLEKCE